MGGTLFQLSKINSHAQAGFLTVKALGFASLIVACAIPGSELNTIDSEQKITDTPSFGNSLPASEAALTTTLRDSIKLIRDKRGIAQQIQ
jgi:hypothetical protein